MIVYITAQLDSEILYNHLSKRAKRSLFGKKFIALLGEKR
jgi:hypothetical protein